MFKPVTKGLNDFPIRTQKGQQNLKLLNKNDFNDAL